MRLSRLASAIALIGFAAVSAQAASVGFEFDGHSTKRNFAKFALTNTSTHASIERMSMTIGKRKYNFDIVRAVDGASMSILKGDNRNNRRRFDEIAMSFDGFDAGSTTMFRLDIDRDSKKRRNKADYRRVLFNNGKAQNAMISVTFSNGEVLSTFIDDQPRSAGLTSRLMQGESYNALASVSQELDDVEIASISAVPVPAALPLMLAGLFGLGMVARRRKN